MGLTRRDRYAAGVIGCIIVFTAVANLWAEPETFPPLLTTVAPFIAAAFFSTRVTAAVALVSLIEGALLSALGDGRTGMALASRVAMTAGSGIFAIVAAEIRLRREMEMAVARDELALASLFQAIVDSANDPIYGKDTSGRYIAANNATARMLGLEHGADVIGHRDREFVSGPRAELVEAADRDTLASGGRLEFEDVPEALDDRIYLTHKTVIKDADGTVIGLSGIAKDVTVKRHAQRELERSEHRFRSLIEALSDVVWRTDSLGRFDSPQRGWQEHTGQTWDPDDPLQWLDAIHHDDRDAFQQRWERSLAGAAFFETSGRLWNAAAGAHRSAIIRAAPVVGPDGAVVEWLWVGEDAHERHIAEQHLRRITKARALVAEIAASAAVASGTQQIAHGGLAVLRQRLPAHVGSITLLDREDTSVTTRFAVSGIDGGVEALPHEIADMDLPSSHVAEVRRVMEFAEPEDLVREYPDARVLTEGFGIHGTTFVIPLDTGFRVMGALTMSFKERLDEEVLEVIRFATSELTAVLANNLLQAEFHEREAEIASTFQQSMLELAVEADPRLALSFHYQAGAEQMEAGGDWYDVVTLADGRIALIVGDVVGRSLRAATVMGRLRGACRGLVLATGDPAEVLAHLDTVAETIEGARYSTCCCVVIDPAAQTATYSSAGHPPTLLLPVDGGAEFLWDAQGPPLTIPVQRRPSATVAFPTGTRLFMYTDGLVERRDEVIDKGLDRLATAAIAGREFSVGDECDRIAVALFDDFEQNDDIAIVCAEIVSDSAEVFHRVMPGSTASLQRVRRDLQVWLKGHMLRPERTNDILLAVGEVLANAVEHGSTGGSQVTLTVTRTGRRELTVTVEDAGRWRENPPNPTRGRGLSIARSIADSTEVERGDGEQGTRVAMTFGL